MSEAVTGSGDLHMESEGTGEILTKQNTPTETFGINCPTCGGSLRVHEGDRSISCEYCHSALYVTRPKGVRSFMMPPRITPGKAKLTALHYLSEKTGGRVKARHASIVDMQLINVPFWRMHGRLMGWVCGDKINLKQVEVVSEAQYHKNTHTTLKEERIPYAKLVFKRVDWSTPACVLPYLGLQGISLRSKFMNWEIFDHKLRLKHNFALPMKSIKRARKDAFNFLTRLSTPNRATVSGSDFHMFDSNFSLFYYPVYFVRYRHGGRIYTITVDGNDGSVTRGEVPTRRSFNARNIFFVPATFAFLTGTYFPLAFIALGVIYALDMFQTEGFLLPHEWLIARLNKWFGGE